MKKALTLLLAVGLLSSCGFIDEAKDNMDHMRNGMDNTNEGIRLQKVGVGKDGIEDPEHAQILSPVPFGIMGYAKLFAENATNEELAAQVYLYLKEIKEAEYMPEFDDEGGVKEMSAQDVADINHQKLHKMTAAQAISGLIPQDRFENLVREYVDLDGRYKKTVYEMMMLRYQFLRDVLLSSSLLKESITSVGTVEDVQKYTEQMDWIAKRPDVDEVGVKVSGFLGDLPSQKEELDADAARVSMLDMLKNISSKTRRFVRRELSLMAESSRKVDVNRRYEAASSAFESMRAYWENQ